MREVGPGGKRLVIIMRKLALLLAAAFLVSAPLIAATPTLTYAAGKTKQSTKKVVRAPAARVPAATEVDPIEANNRFAHAVNDLARSMATYRHVYPPVEGGNRAARAARAAR